jgi:anaerobic C4-dicarboxylate transporter
MPPGTPPVDVMLTIVAVVAASATLQASGGLDVLLQLAEKCCAATRSTCRSWRPSRPS